MSSSSSEKKTFSFASRIAARPGCIDENGAGKPAALWGALPPLRLDLIRQQEVLCGETLPVDGGPGSYPTPPPTPRPAPDALPCGEARRVDGGPGTYPTPPPRKRTIILRDYDDDDTSDGSSDKSPADAKEGAACQREEEEEDEQQEEEEEEPQQEEEEEEELCNRLFGHPTIRTSYRLFGLFPFASTMCTYGREDGAVEWTLFILGIPVWKERSYSVGESQQ
jgi:hypothetical protein